MIRVWLKLPFAFDTEELHHVAYLKLSSLQLAKLAPEGGKFRAKSDDVDGSDHGDVSQVFAN